MACLNKYHVNCDSQFFYITTLDCDNKISHVEKLFRSSVDIEPDYATETVKIAGLNEYHSRKVIGLSVEQTVTGCENAISANELATFNINCVEFSPSEDFLNLIACLEQCAYGCCDGNGGGISGSPFATVVYTQNGNDPILSLSGGTTNADCLNQFRAFLEIKNNANTIVHTFRYFNAVPRSINVNSLNLADGFYLATLTVIDCSNKQASDSVSFTLAPLTPPTGSITYDANNLNLNFLARSNDPICAGSFEATITINDGTTNVYSELFDQDDFPTLLDVGIGGLGLANGAYTATLVVEDCTNLKDTSILTFIVGQGNIPPTALLTYAPSTSVLDITAIANDPACNGVYTATIEISDDVGVRYTRNFSSALPLNSLIISSLGLSEGSFTARLTVVDCNGLQDIAILTFTYTIGSTLPFVDIDFDSDTSELLFEGGSTDPTCNGEFNATLIILNLLGQQVYTDSYDETNFPDKLDVTTITPSLSDGNYIAQITLTDCTGETVIDSTTFAISVNFAPPVATLVCSSDGAGINITADTREPSCGGTFSAILEIFDTANNLIDTKNYTQATFPNTLTFLELELADGVYRFKLTVENCKELIDTAEATCTVSEVPPLADLQFDGVNLLGLTAESRDPLCEGVFEASLTIIDTTAAIIFESTYDNTNIPTSIDIGDNGLNLAAGIYIATLTVDDCTETSAVASLTFEVPDALPPCADIEYDSLSNELDLVCAAPQDSSCDGQDYSIILTITRRVVTGGGSGNEIEFIVYNASWTQDTVVNPLALDPLNLETGDYIATLTVTDCTGLTSTDSVEWVVSDTCELVTYSDSIEDFTDNFDIINNNNGTVTVTFGYDPSSIAPNVNIPTGLNAINITLTSARLTWNAPSSGIPVAYNIRFRKVGTSGWATQTVPASVLFLDVQNLVGNTSYEFQVQAVYNGATSGYTASYTFLTSLTTNPPIVNDGTVRDRWGVTVVADNHNDKSAIYRHLRWYLYQVDLTSGGGTSNASNLAFDPFYGFGGNVCNSHDGCVSGADTIIDTRFAASEVNLSLQGGASYLRPPDGGNDRHVATDQHTGSGPVNSNNPSSYSQQAEMMFQLAARYGSNAIDVNDPRLGAASNQTIRTGLGTVKRIMPWNETYEHWEQSGYSNRNYTDLNGNSGNRARGDWHPHEETAMMVQCYNRIKEADPNMLVLWPGNVKWDGFRSDGGQWAKVLDACNQLNGGAFPADEYCVHIYWNDKYADRTQDYTQAINFSAQGSEPEAHGGVRVFVKDMIDMVRQSYPTVSVNITEIGYDVSGSPQQVKFITGKTTRQTYGDWTVRLHLALLATDVNITMQYALDHSWAGGAGWLFDSCGVVDGNNDIAEPAWYMTKQFLDILGNYKFQSVVQEQDGGTWIYKFEDASEVSKKAYVVWNGTAFNQITSNFQLQLGAGENSPLQHKLNYNSISSTVSTLTPNGSNIVNLMVTETPQIVLVNS